MPAMIVAVINESLDSAVERGPVFLWQNVNILAFYRFPKSFNSDVIFSSAAAVHADPHLRVLRTGFNPCLASELITLTRVNDLRCVIWRNRVPEHFYAVRGVQRVCRLQPTMKRL